MLEKNTQLGRYVVRSLLGAGGMGEVYLARDPKIGRDVAIKVLSASYTADDQHLARFKQEAHAAGTLNHPNILSVYDIGVYEGSPYVVSELLEGSTLQTVIRQPLPVRKAVDYALQIAKGLAAAHEKGIVHRDLKPENIFLTKDGRIKILDFGLAKLVQPDGPLGPLRDESTREITTEPGIVLGTIGYMSPEQVRGQQVDTRSDIFSFGVVLYEMLTGKKAFARESMADAISAVLKEDPQDLMDANPAIPPALERLVRHCLEKRSEQRFHSASDLAFALEALDTTRTNEAPITTSTGGWTSPDKNWKAWAGWIAAAVLLVSSLALAAVLFWGNERKLDPRMQFSILAPEGTTFGSSGVGNEIALSPDGRKLAFVAFRGANRERSLWIRSLENKDAAELPGTVGAAQPFWSPNSRSICFFAERKLKKVDISTGSLQALTDVSDDPRGGSWSVNDTIIFSPNITSPLVRIPAAGGSPEAVTVLDGERSETSHRWPSFLPDGDHFLYFGRGTKKDLEGIFVASMTTGERRFLFANETMAAYAASADTATGHLLFVHAGVLKAQPFDPRTLQLSGAPVEIANNVASFATEVGATAYAAFSASSNGHLLFSTAGDQTNELAWFDRSGNEVGKVTPPGSYYAPYLSPDGKKVIFAWRNGTNDDLKALDLSTGSSVRFTFDAANDVLGVWSPDGEQIAFASDRGGGSLKIYRKNADGSGEEEMLFGAETNAIPDDWSKNGDFLLFYLDSGLATKNDLMLLSMKGERRVVPYLQTQFTESHGRFSPDGRWVAYTSDASGKPDIYVRSFPSGNGLWQISTAGGDSAQWSSDGKELFYMAPDRNLMVVPVNTRGTFSYGEPKALFTTKVPLTGLIGYRNSFLVSNDGQRFMISRLTDERYLQPLTLVLNWNLLMNRAN